jgi:hypothetical protein
MWLSNSISNATMARRGEAWNLSWYNQIPFSGSEIVALYFFLLPPWSKNPVAVVVKENNQEEVILTKLFQNNLTKENHCLFCWTFYYRCVGYSNYTRGTTNNLLHSVHHSHTFTHLLHSFPCHIVPNPDQTSSVWTL